METTNYYYYYEIFIIDMSHIFKYFEREKNSYFSLSVCLSLGREIKGYEITKNTHTHTHKDIPLKVFGSSVLRCMKPSLCI